MWYVRPATVQTSMRIGADSDQSLCLSLIFSMTVTLLTKHHLEFLKEAAQAHLSLHLSKYHIVGNHMPGSCRKKPWLCCMPKQTCASTHFLSLIREFFVL